MVKKAGFVCATGLVASYLLISAPEAAAATTTCQQCCPSANAWMPPAATILAAIVAGAVSVRLFILSRRLQTELVGLSARAAEHTKNVEILGAFSLSLTEYRRTQRATHLLKLFQATSLSPRQASPSAAPPAQAQPLPPSPTDPTRRAWATAVLDNLRAAYIDGAGLFLGYAKDVYHRVRELLEGSGVEKVTASDLEAATERMLSVLRTALILEVEGSPDPNAETNAKATRDDFIANTNRSTPEENLTYLAQVHAYLKSQPTSKHVWPSPEEMGKPAR